MVLHKKPVAAENIWVLRELAVIQTEDRWTIAGEDYRATRIKSARGFHFVGVGHSEERSTGAVVKDSGGQRLKNEQNIVRKRLVIKLRT